MAMQIRRGTNAERQLMTPLQGELIFTTDTKKLYVGDGTTLGGVVVDTTGGSADGNTTYAISAETATGGANLRLTGSDASTDNVKIAAGSNVTITRTDSSTITIASAGVGGPVALDELSDVTITGTPTDGQVLKYDSGTSQWVNGTDESGTIVGVLDDLTDVTITGTPANGEVLQYDSITNTWINNPAVENIEDLTNVQVDELTLTPGQVLKYNGAYWTNGDDSLGTGGGGVAVLDELDDVQIDYLTLSLGQTLTFNGSSWANADPAAAPTVALDDITDVVVTVGTLASGQVLKYDGSNWVNAEDNAGSQVETLNDLTDTAIGAASPGEILTFNGSNWVNAIPATSALDELTDVVITSGTLAAGQVLKYDGGTWVNADDDIGPIVEILNDLTDVNIGAASTTDYLVFNGSSWVDSPLDISHDTSPFLGGSLDLANYDITGIGNIDITGDITLTGSVNTNRVTASTGLQVVAPDNTYVGMNLIGSSDSLQPVAIQISAGRGPVTAPQDTLAGDILGGLTVTGWSDTDYKTAGAIFSTWSTGATMTKVYPKSSMWFIVNNDTDTTVLAPTASLRGEGIFTAKIFKNTPQTTTAMGALVTPEAGMIYFDSTLQKFRGYVSDTGLAGGGAPNSTPGWVDLN